MRNTVVRLPPTCGEGEPSSLYIGGPIEVCRVFEPLGRYCPAGKLLVDGVCR